MRLNDRHDGSIKTLLILGLLAANIALTLPNDKAPSPSPRPIRTTQFVLPSLPNRSIARAETRSSYPFRHQPDR